MASLFTRLLIAPLLVLSFGLQAYSQSVPEVLVEGASLTLPVVNDNGDTVDEVTLHVVEITDQNESDVLSLSPVVLQAQELPSSKYLNVRSIGHWAKTISSKIEKRRDRLEGLAFAASSSVAGYLGLWLVAGNSASSSAIISTTMFSIAVFQASFTNMWQSYLQKGLYLKNFLGFFKKDLIDNELVKSIGNIKAAAIFNIAPTTLALTLTGHYDNFATAALTGVLGAYDYTVDITVGKLNRRGYVSDKLMKKVVRYRLLTGPILEMFSLSGSSTAQIIMGVIGTSGVVAILRGEKLVDDINKAVAIFTLKSLRQASCRQLLTAYPFPHIRSFEDVQ